MTQSSELLALAERCEAATGPDRELDRDIATALISYPPPKWMNGKHVRRKNAKPYTASIDAALTLVPEGLVPDMLGHSDGTFTWRLRERDRLHLLLGHEGRAKTLALALCVAALRTLATKDERHEG